MMFPASEAERAVDLGGGVFKRELPALVENIAETDTAIDFDRTVFKTVLEGV